jgi:hypothetical protein
MSQERNFKKAHQQEQVQTQKTESQVLAEEMEFLFPEKPRTTLTIRR